MIHNFCEKFFCPSHVSFDTQSHDKICYRIPFYHCHKQWKISRIDIDRTDLYIGHACYGVHDRFDEPMLLNECYPSSEHDEQDVDDCRKERFDQTEYEYLRLYFQYECLYKQGSYQYRYIERDAFYPEFFFLHFPHAQYEHSFASSVFFLHDSFFVFWAITIYFSFVKSS